MVGAALEALVGSEPAPDALEAALATIPATSREEALRWLAREHGTAALPILGRCLAGRSEWAIAAAEALATLRAESAVRALEAAEATGPPKPVRTAIRRALYRLRQVGVAPPAGARPAPAPGGPRHRPERAWVSAIDGTGTCGLWLAVRGPHGEQVLLSAVVSDVVGVLEFGAGALSRRGLEARLRTLGAESPLPWVEVPAGWAWAALVAARDRGSGAGPAATRELARWVAALGPAAPPGPPPAAARPAAAPGHAPIEASATLLELPELGSWFLDPALVQSEALELLQARESRLVVSAEVKAERAAGLVDRVIDARFDAATRQRWQGRLEHAALVLEATARPAEAGLARAVAAALADLERPARHLPFVRALVERSLEVAGEVTLGRLPAAEASRVARRRSSSRTGDARPGPG